MEQNHSQIPPEIPSESAKPSIAGKLLARLDEIKPDRSKLLLLIGVIGGLVAAALMIVIIWGQAHLPKTQVTAPQTVQASIGEMAQIQITAAGFVPATLQIKPGTTVVWVNETDNVMKIGADPYPTHASLPSLYSQAPIQSHSSYSYTFNAAGTYSYHNEASPTLGGSISVVR